MERPVKAFPLPEIKLPELETETPCLLFFVRHGETVWSETSGNRFAGWTDVPLTEKGRYQAKMAGKILAEIRIDKAYSSDLSRAVETARLVLKAAIKIYPLSARVLYEKGITGT